MQRIVLRLGCLVGFALISACSGDRKPAGACTTDRDCPAKNQRCEGGGCVTVPGAPCDADVDCTSPSFCQIGAGAECYGGTCHYLPGNLGVQCDDANLCTPDEVCDAAGRCTGTAKACTTPPSAECVGTNDTFRQYNSPGTCDPVDGECDYTSTDTACTNCAHDCLDPCLNVTCDDNAGGCRLSNGICDPVPDPVSCDYSSATPATDDTPCLRFGDTVPGGYCFGGECGDCTSDLHCDEPPGDPACFVADCNAPICEYTQLGAATVCQTAGCADGQINVERTCGAAGDCAGGASTSCNGFVCATASTCATACSAGSGCVADFFCNDPTAGDACLPKVEDGQSCGSYGNAACLSDHCIGGICCTGGTCCANPGGCTVLVPFEGACTSPATCQGSHYRAECTDFVCEVITSDDDSYCLGVLADACGPYLDLICDGTVEQQPPSCPGGCAGDNNACDAGYYCDGSDQCVAQLGLGAVTCDEDSDCDSNHCDLSATGSETGRCCAAGECCDVDADCVAGDQCVDLLDGAPVYRCYSGANGEPCDDGDDCDGGVCNISGVCGVLLGVGATGCTGDGDCTSNHCDMSVTGPETGRCCAAGECCDADIDCAANDQCVDLVDSVPLYTCRWGAPSDPCDDDSDCAAGNHCRESTDVCVTGAVGQPCDDSGDCDAGTYCTSGAVCATQLGIGATTCAGNDQCTSAYCDLSTTGPETGRCCSGDQCCDADADCPAGWQCIDLLDAAATYRCYTGSAGAACDDDSDCDSGNWCRESTNVCVLGSIGQACDDAGDCDSPLVCLSNNTCADELPTGGTLCNDNGDCVGDHCDLSTAGPETGRCCVGGPTSECCDVDADCPAGDQCIDLVDGVAIYGCRTGGVNQPCDDDSDCDAGNLCRESTNTCVDGEPGSPCDNIGDCDSASPLYCSASNICDFQLSIGATVCTYNEMCQSNYCDLSTAGPERYRCCASGECCDQDGDCPSGYQCVVTVDVTQKYYRCYTGGSSASVCDTDADCDPGWHCRESTDRCTSGASGSSCDDNLDCDPGLSCNPSTHTCG